MATYYDEHAELELVQSRLTAVIGDTADTVVHASALRDAGVSVNLGASPGASAHEHATMIGIETVGVAEAVHGADLVVVIDTDPAACERFAELAVPALEPGASVVVTDPVVLRFGFLTVPPDRDIVVVQPLASARQIELELAAGRGVPVLVAVHTDVSGGALALALSYAKALGGTRAGAIGTTVEAAAETEVFGEYGVAGAVIDGLVSAGFDALVEAGYPRDLAYLACVHSLRGAVERVASDGDGLADGSLGEYARRTGGNRLADDHLREVLRRALADVRSGALAARLRR